MVAEHEAVGQWTRLRPGDLHLLADEQRIEGFRIGASALVAAASHIERYLAATGRLGSGAQSLERRFDADRCAFNERFCILYGVSP